MLEIKPHSDFRKDLQRDKSSGHHTNSDLELVGKTINSLANMQKLDEKYKDHALNGKMKKYRECHIKPDWLLVYKIDKASNILYLARLGTHNQIFNK